jgi:peptidyl-tRNA hydrolase
MTNPELYLYVLVRTDLSSMKMGKGCAQGAHAANQFTDEHIIRPLLAGEKPSEGVMTWRQEADGFGTTITLDIASLSDMQAVVSAAQKLGFKANVTVDPEYPYIVDSEIYPLIAPETHTAPAAFIGDGKFVCFRRETTTAYVFGEKEKLAVLLKRFKLLSND